eukprot:5182843-Pleurochrysis_carterae.AAC.1
MHGGRNGMGCRTRSRQAGKGAWYEGRGLVESALWEKRARWGGLKSEREGEGERAMGEGRGGRVE